MNQLIVIHPYKANGMWVFDDAVRIPERTMDRSGRYRLAGM